MAFMLSGFFLLDRSLRSHDKLQKQLRKHTHEVNRGKRKRFAVNEKRVISTNKHILIQTKKSLTRGFFQLLNLKSASLLWSNTYRSVLNLFISSLCILRCPLIVLEKFGSNSLRLKTKLSFLGERFIMNLSDRINEVIKIKYTCTLHKYKCLKAGNN